MRHKLTWDKLLSGERASRHGSSFSADTSYRSKDERTPFEQDYDRIVFSAPFRRLAKKTQVHPMASNDHIHNRLTHSIEVASVGRSFASRVEKLAREQSDLGPGRKSDLEWILQSACLIHDLGNPPFGHAGEEVIREWAAGHESLFFPEDRFAGEAERRACRDDWLHFEGNAQGFRFASRPDNPIAGYLRLTYATLAAAVKYPWSSSDARAREKRKHNYYGTEAELFGRMAETLGLSDGRGEPCRHPLSFLMEAADDICYRIIDLEDAVEMGICDSGQVKALFVEIAGNKSFDWMLLPQLRGQAIKSLMDQCWAVFAGDFAGVMHGERTNDLKSDLSADCKAQLDEVRKLYDSIFGHRKKVATELGAYHILGRILKAFVKTAQSIVDAESYADVHFLSKRTIELTWGRPHVEANLERPYAWWLSQVMDFVSGMTDDYAARLSREIGGLLIDAG